MIASIALGLVAALAAPVSVVPTALPPRLERPVSSETRAFWERAWTRLDRVDRSTRREVSWRRAIAELTDLAAERRIASLSRADEDDLFRTRLLGWHLDRLRGGREAPLDAPPPGFPWLEGEAWFAARALRPGASRSEAMMRALAAAAPAERGRVLAVAEPQVLEELSVGNADGAADLAARIDALEPSTERGLVLAWTAGQAARTESAAATMRLRAASGDAADEAAYRVALARLALSRGDEIGARADLGAALAAGAPRAAMLVARAALDRGEARRARVLLRGWLEDPSVGGELGALWVLATLEAQTPSRTPRPETGSGVPVR